MPWSEMHARPEAETQEGVCRGSSSLALHVTFFQANQNGYHDQKGYHRENLRGPDTVFSRVPVASGSEAEIVHSFGSCEISLSYPTGWRG